MQNKFSDRAPLIWLSLSLCLGVALSVSLLASLALFDLPPAVRAQGNILYVDPDAPGPHDGSSWSKAYTDLQTALTAAISGTEIWIADGVYYPGPAGALTATFPLTNGVALYGGFAGYGVSETQRMQRDWQSYMTVLSGDLDRNDQTDANGVVTDTAGITGTNAYHVVTGSGTDATAVLDGFTITAGYANGYGTNNGGGMFIVRGSPKLDNLLFSGNWAQNAGGGMHISWSSPTLTDITFESNWAGAQGGGLLETWWSSPRLVSVTFSGNYAGNGGGMYAWNSSGVLSHVTFSRNQARSGGGGMYSEGGTPSLETVIFRDNQARSGGGMRAKGSACSLTNVVFYGNQAEREGGGMEIAGGAAKLTNIVFSGNRANMGGGGMCIWPEWYTGKPSTPELINVTFSGNQAGDRGGAIHNYKSNPTLVNCILWGDSASTEAEIFNVTGTVTVTYSNIQWASGIYTGTGNMNVDPRFVKPITATAAPTTAGDYRLLDDSPAIDAGNNLSVTVATDLDGNPRIRDGDCRGGPRVDLGAYEYYGCSYIPLVFRDFAQ